mgnify:CR=1 FL=1
MRPLLTVALCTHNHADRLRRTLSDLSRLRHPEHPWEFLVIDNGSTDGSQAIAETRGARVVPVAERGYGAALLRMVISLVLVCGVAWVIRRLTLPPR